MRRSIILDIAAIGTFGIGVLIGAATAPKRTIWIGAELCCSPITPIQPPETVYIPKNVWEQCGGQPDDYLAFKWAIPFGSCYLANPSVWEGTDPPGPCIAPEQIAVFACYDGLPPYDPCDGCCGFD